MPTRIASNHALAFRCTCCGACCQAGWQVPLDPYDAAALRRAATLPALHGLMPDDALQPAPGGGAFLGGGGEACPLLRGDLRCALHAVAGAEALPVPCRNYPVDVVATPWGSEVYLELTCPTAVGLLAATPFALVRDPPWTRESDLRQTRFAQRPLAVRPGESGDWGVWLKTRRAWIEHITAAGADGHRAAVALATAASGRGVDAVALMLRLSANPLGPAALAEAWQGCRPFWAVRGAGPLHPEFARVPGLGPGAPMLGSLGVALLAHKLFQGGLQTGLSLVEVANLALWTWALAERYAQAACAAKPAPVAAVAAAAGVIAAEFLIHANLRSFDLAALPDVLAAEAA